MPSQSGSGNSGTWCRGCRLSHPLLNRIWYMNWLFMVTTREVNTKYSGSLLHTIQKQLQSGIAMYVQAGQSCGHLAEVKVCTQATIPQWHDRSVNDQANQRLTCCQHYMTQSGAHSRSPMECVVDLICETETTVHKATVRSFHNNAINTHSGGLQSRNMENHIVAVYNERQKREKGPRERKWNDRFMDSFRSFQSRLCSQFQLQHYHLVRWLVWAWWQKTMKRPA